MGQGKSGGKPPHSKLQPATERRKSMRFAKARSTLSLAACESHLATNQMGGTPIPIPPGICKDVKGKGLREGAFVSV